MKLTFACATPLAVSLAILLSGCGGGGTTPSTPQTPTTLAAPAPAATVAPAAGAPTTTLEGQAADDDFPPPLLAWAEADPEDGPAPLTVQFKADIEGGGPPLKYKWSFGDSTPDSTEANPKHTYEKPGKYRADLNVENANGEDSDSDYVEIEAKEPAKK